MKTQNRLQVLAFALGSTLLLCLLTPTRASAFPETINYQGVLTDAVGQPITGSVDMTFSFYTAPTGGAHVWSETQTVQVDQGIYNVQIGITEPSGFPITFYTSYYMGITIGTGSEMTPRQSLTAVPYAFHSMWSEVASNADHVSSGAITSASIQDGAITDADIGGVISAAKLGSHKHSGVDITSGTVANARIAASIARDSEILPTVLANDGAASGLDADLLDGADSSTFGSAAAVATLQSQVAALQSQVSVLQSLLQHFSRNGNDITISGANLHIVDGSGNTWGTNGLGNLIVGYNELRGDATDNRSGSHNLVLGARQSYSSYGGFLAGTHNTITGSYSSISGGKNNTVSGSTSCISGGTDNSVTTNYASISGGRYNTASNFNASVSGGYGNTASGASSSVCGGDNNTAAGDSSSVSGGSYNHANASYASVSGGQTNTAAGLHSSVSGGWANTANANHSAVAGGTSVAADVASQLAIGSKHYSATSTAAADVTSITTEHSICALTHVSLQTGDATNYKYCTLTNNVDGTWTLTAHGGSSTTIRCDAECF